MVCAHCGLSGLAHISVSIGVAHAKEIGLAAVVAVGRTLPVAQGSVYH
jgi:hypothetical protein